MEELKMLVDLVKDLPQLAVWALLGLLFYKVFIVGGTLTVVRLLIDKIHNWSVTPRSKYIHEVATTEVEGITIKGCKPGLLRALKTVTDRRGGEHDYIHDTDVVFLQTAVNEKLQRDGEK